MILIIKNTMVPVESPYALNGVIASKRSTIGPLALDMLILYPLIESTMTRDIPPKTAGGQPLKNSGTTSGGKGVVPIRLPNGYGSVVKLSGKRRRPYMVRGGVYGYDDRGYPQYDVVGYAETREQGLTMLAEYNRNPWDEIGRAHV